MSDYPEFLTARLDELEADLTEEPENNSPKNEPTTTNTTQPATANTN